MGGFFYPQGSSGGGGSFSGLVTYGAPISPTALAAGTTNDWNPTGVTTANRIRVTTNVAGSSIGGFAAPSPVTFGTSYIILNLGPGDLILIDEGAGSAAGNRFAMPADFLIPMDYGWAIIYDESARWRLW